MKILPTIFDHYTIIHKSIISIFKKFDLLNCWLFGVKNSKDKSVLLEILKNTDEEFTVWALRNILNYEKSGNLDVVRIHGTHDKIIPYFPSMKASNLIKGGGHLMTLTHYSEIEQIIYKHLNF